LGELNKLLDDIAANSQMHCRLCGANADQKLEVTFLGRYNVKLYLCPGCGLLQTERPFWLAEAYGKAISILDTGILQRNLTFMRILSVLLRLLAAPMGVYLDYGGGHGLFTRLMRDHGYDFRWSDPHAENIYANGFAYNNETELTGITAFEVIEHLDNPRLVFDEIFGKKAPAFVFISTTLFAGAVDPGWEYLQPQSGQHITFFQKKTMKYIADLYGYRWSNWRYFHLFTKSSPAVRFAKLLIPLSLVLYPFMYLYFRKKSLNLKDQATLAGKIRG
jgi:hypothetical protein